MDVESATGDEEVNMVIDKTTSLNQTNNQTGEHANEVPAYYARRQERIIEGVIGTKMHPNPDEFDDVDQLSNIKLFAQELWFDTDALGDDDSFNRYATKGYSSEDIPLRELKTSRGVLVFHALTRTWPLFMDESCMENVNSLRVPC